MEKELGVDFEIKKFDPRISASLNKGADLLYRGVGNSFSQCLGASFRQTISRILSEEKMKSGDILCTHIKSTVKRCCNNNSPYIVVTQDTTYYNLTGHKKMTGNLPIQGNILGTVQHNILALTSSGSPLGLLGQHNWVRGGSGDDLWTKESEKWSWGLEQANKLLGKTGKKVVLVQDREADIYDFFRAKRSSNVELLIRVYQDRKYELATSEEESVVAYLHSISHELTFVEHKIIEIKRDNKPVWVTLAIYADKVSIHPPKDSPKSVQPITMTLVRAYEIKAVNAKSELVEAKSEQKLEWLLVSTMELNEKVTAFTLVEFYCLRWMVERFHFVLKSGGYNVEKLQFDNVPTFINALAFYSVLAWKVMYFSDLTRNKPLAPATEIFNEDEIQTMGAINKEPRNKYRTS